ncbi:hypothetical protein Q6348_13975 [Isoptericola sp. b441]|uniref:Uncharacterized protein n=1 Tax=Actinotalea lenta TaxID=3064654 RepID=A0ABT9DBP9_9CELL|nr:hypothetical protein [Isoptericola sp. b441]MDO8108303.1 hypothetical protein [Isoptericola sp. b441]
MMIDTAICGIDAVRPALPTPTFLQGTAAPARGREIGASPASAPDSSV